MTVTWDDERTIKRFLDVKGISYKEIASEVLRRGKRGVPVAFLIIVTGLEKRRVREVKDFADRMNITLQIKK